MDKDDTAERRLRRTGNRDEKRIGPLNGGLDMRYRKDIIVMLAIGLLVAGWPIGGRAETRFMTVQELIAADHRITVPAGTVVEWRDPHFETVWFPSSPDGPRVELEQGSFRTVFAKAGTYRGRFTVVGGHRSNDIYPLIVTVTKP